MRKLRASASLNDAERDLDNEERPRPAGAEKQADSSLCRIVSVTRRSFGLNGSKY